jgi:hypothetical protein
LSARRHLGEQGRFGVAADGGALGRRAAIVFQLEQSKLPLLGAFPRLKLLASEFANLLPAMGVAADKYDVGF